MTTPCSCWLAVTIATPYSRPKFSNCKSLWPCSQSNVHEYNPSYKEWGFIFYKKLLYSISKYWAPNDKVQSYYKKKSLFFLPLGPYFPKKMPTRQKILMFSSGFLTSFGAFIVICSVLATQEWIRSTIAINDPSSNGSVIISYGLFRGKSIQELNHGLAESDKDFEGKWRGYLNGYTETELPG